MPYHTPAPQGGARGFFVTEPQPNPLAAHLMGLVEGRQQSELAKISMLGNIVSKLGELSEQLARIEKLLEEQTDRMRG